MQRRPHGGDDVTIAAASIGVTVAIGHGASARPSRHCLRLDLQFDCHTKIANWQCCLDYITAIAN